MAAAVRWGAIGELGEMGEMGEIVPANDLAQEPMVYVQYTGSTLTGESLCSIWRSWNLLSITW
jgi:hypothetical protein